MFKAVSTKIALFAFTIADGAPKTGDAANLTAYVSKDYGTVTVLGDTSATEMDATNAPGWYLFDVTGTEATADALLFTGKSSTSGVKVVGQYVFTTPNRFSSLVIDAAGLADANAVKIGPTGAGTAQTARDIGASVLLSTGTGTGQLDFTSGVVKTNVTQWLGTAVSTPTVAGVPNVNVKTWNDLATVALPLVPTTAGRTLDVSAGGEAGVDWANVGSPTTALALTGTTIATTQKVDVETIKTQAVTAAAGVTFPTSIASPTNITAGTITTTTNLTTNNDKTGYGLSAAAVQAIWDALTSALTTVGSIGKKLADWSIGTAQTGDAYARLGAPAGASVSADIAAAKVDTAAIKVKTDFLPSATAGAAGGVFIAGSNAATSITTALTANVIGNVTGNLSGSVGSVTGNIGGSVASVVGAVGSVTGLTASDIGAIKTQTDKLAFTVANQVDVNVLDWKGATAPAMTGDAFARLGAPAGASVSADIAAAKMDTAGIKTVTDRLDNTVENTSDGYVFTVNALQNVPAGSSPTAAAIADAVWEEAIADHSGTGGSAASDIAAILLDTGTDGVVVASASKTGYRLSSTGVDDVLDEVVEGSTTLRESVRLANAALGGKASGLETTEATFRDLADTKDRIVATVDADGNRTAVTRDLT